MKPALRVHSLSKQYRIGSRSSFGGYQTLREALTSSATAFWRQGRNLIREGISRASQPRSEPREFYALQDVSFDVQPGEVIGIIGRNGAGKSTLLKILSRITEPSSGRAEVRGRMGSLLEVGTGFHAELTGRENIYLNGAILGMARRQIAARFDEIVAFSEIEKFLDTPVKRYSSGMYIRLAFAVAAHLEPEILIVDEVLAVGDAEFQKKCLGKMKGVGREGKTVLFVSHNLPALQSLCTRGILLQSGRVIADAPVGDAVREYLQRADSLSCQDLSSRVDRKGKGIVRLEKIEVQDGDHRGGLVSMGRPVRIDFQMNRLLPGLSCVFTIVDQHGYSLAKFSSRLLATGDQFSGKEPRMTCLIDDWPLAPGRYRLDVTVATIGEVQDVLEGAASFDVECGPVQGREPPRSSNDWKVAVPHRWLLPESAEFA